MIHYEVGPDQIGRITLDRPEAKNALTIEMRDGIVDAVRDARGNPEVRALLLTASGDAFCAGGSACRPSSESCGSSTSPRSPR